MVSFSSAVSLGFQRWSDFSGRSTRAEFWWWNVFISVVSVLAQFVDLSIGETDAVWRAVSIVFFVPNLAVLVRRLHDVGKSGWALFINLIPIVGWLICLKWLLTGSETDNKYGSPRSQKTQNDDNPHTVCDGCNAVFHSDAEFCRECGKALPPI